MIDYDVDCSFDEVLDVANGYDNKDQFIAALSVLADERGVELPEEWWSCIVEDYTPRQKRFAEICREVIVPELKRMMEEVLENDTNRSEAMPVLRRESDTQ